MGLTRLMRQRLKMPPNYRPRREQRWLFCPKQLSWKELILPKVQLPAGAAPRPARRPMVLGWVLKLLSRVCLPRMGCLYFPEPRT